MKRFLIFIILFFAFFSHSYALFGERYLNLSCYNAGNYTDENVRIRYYNGGRINYMDLSPGESVIFPQDNLPNGYNMRIESLDSSEYHTYYYDCREAFRPEAPDWYIEYWQEEEPAFIINENEGINKNVFTSEFLEFFFISQTAVLLLIAIFNFLIFFTKGRKS